MSVNHDLRYYYSIYCLMIERINQAKILSITTLNAVRHSTSSIHTLFYIKKVTFHWSSSQTTLTII